MHVCLRSDALRTFPSLVRNLEKNYSKKKANPVLQLKARQRGIRFHTLYEYMHG